LNRLKQADGYQIANNTFSPIGYNELLGYDKQGNLNLLQRNTGTANLDNLTYSYTGNQISSISDSYGSKNQYTIKEYNNLYRSTDFSYDPNGNMTKDLDRKIVTIRYNILNLPDTVQFSNGNQIVNLYSADGRKLGTEYFTQVTDLAIPLTAGKTITQSYIPGTVNQNGKAYVDNKIYNTLNGFWTLSTLARISNTEGYYISYNSTPYSGYHYNRTDHLGNIREVWHAASKTTIQRTQYYPSGLPWATTTADNPSMQPYKYNGKEFDEMNGWDTYDYGARGYYPASGRFMTVDPLAERRPWMSPYVFCSDNPVNRIDMDGNWDVSVHLAQNRSQNGYGVAIVTDRNGNEVYRFQVRAEGTGGRNRMNKNADTPLGTYDIPDKNTWGTGGSRASYGPNARLNMTPESGEIEESGRDAIRIHGGRQEVYDSKTGKWTPSDSPELKKTNGCLRAFDTDMSAFKKITDNLQKTDSKEIPGQVTITDDLDKLGSPTKTETVEGVKLQYFVPEAQLNYWQNVVKKVFDNKNNGGQ